MATSQIPVSLLVRALEAAWHDITARHPELPHVVIVVASGTESKHARWGHYAPARWHAGDADHHEIMISGEGLARTPHEVLGTLLHEATHALADVRGIQDTSRQGRYHNTRFRDLATELGITVAQNGKFGWSTTTVPDHTLTNYASTLQRLERVMVLWRRAEIHTGQTGTRKNTNLIAALCDCGRTIRIAASSLDAAPVTCGACGSDFQPKDPT